MLSGSVYPGKGLLVKQAGQPVASRYLLHGLHHKLIVIHRGIGHLIDGGKLVLGRRHLIVLGLGGNAQLPELDVQIPHISPHPLTDGSEIVILQLLPFRRGRAKERPSGKDQIRPL